MNSSRQPYCAENFKLYSVFCNLYMHSAFFGVIVVTFQQPFRITFDTPRVDNVHFPRDITLQVKFICTF